MNYTANKQKKSVQSTRLRPTVQRNLVQGNLKHWEDQETPINKENKLVSPCRTLLNLILIIHKWTCGRPIVLTQCWTFQMIYHQIDTDIYDSQYEEEFVMEVWPKPWDFNIRNHIFQVFRSLAMILHANKQEVGGLINIIVGLPQRLLCPLPGKAHICEGGHQNWAGRRLTSSLEGFSAVWGRPPELG